ncbi:MAG: tetratricopeptide repeat protein [Thermomonas sp.]|uniref:tetratricopeptide repeat protein n=1 Tax=Thermomonas sp. TaxID=1971895 RepID=UPI0039E4F55E
MKLHPKHAILSAVIALALGGTLIGDAAAQSSRRGDKKQQKTEVLFPEASRQEPGLKTSSKNSKKVQQLIEAYNKQEWDKVRPLGDELLALENANAYEKSLGAQLAAQAAYDQDDNAAARKYLQQAIELNGLDNNSHYQSMLMLAQLHIMDDEYAPGLAMLDRYLSESKSTKPDDLALKGQTLYQMERYQDAIPVLQGIVTGTPEPKDNWVQLLLACYAEAGKTTEALALAEQLAAKKPDDKKTQMLLATAYSQAEQDQKAAAVLEKLRASGQLSEDREYRQLYITYANMEGREKDVIAVINEGIQKGVLKEDQQTYLALAQSYYYSDQIPQAIANWEKAAPLSKDGQTYYNLAVVLQQEGRIAEAKAAAQKALDKGLKSPEQARRILQSK